MINLIILMLILCVPAMVFADQKTEFELKAIDKKIAELKAEYHKEQLTEMHKEVESQELMIADWEAYGKEVQEIRKLDIQTDKILKEIEELEQRKNTLIKQNTVK
jgi:transketolase N-terminal domain/subunit